MILIRFLIILLFGLCSAQIRDGARLNLISNKVEALEKIVTSLENTISKLEVSRAQRTHIARKPNSLSPIRRKISNWRKKLIPKISKRMLQPSSRNQPNSPSVLKHSKSLWAHKTRPVLVKRIEFKSNYSSHTVNTIPGIFFEKK